MSDKKSLQKDLKQATPTVWKQPEAHFTALVHQFQSTELLI